LIFIKRGTSKAEHHLSADLPVTIHDWTSMRTALLLTAAGAALALSLSAQAAVDVDAANKALKDNGCTKCHSVDKTKKGPSFQKTAAKYKGKADAEAKLTTFLTTSPKIKVDDAEEEHKAVPKDSAQLKNMIQFILSQ
jgi:cytochrome c